jgi:hypothetical protein|tara:strand:- start:271 stop:618 length:348 start_codon:yes stop_codon:yes gene_type:complete
MIDGRYEERLFSNKEDVWEVVDLIIEETKIMNNEHGKSFDIASSIGSQIPFFACPNFVFDKLTQKDIQRYIYCENFKTPAFPGCYGEQPSRWVQKSYIIRKALNRLQNKAVKNDK